MSLLRTVVFTWWAGLLGWSAANLAVAAEPTGPASRPMALQSLSNKPGELVRHWILPRPNPWGHIEVKQLGLVINVADPYSVEVGEYYAKARGLAPEQVLRVTLPVVPELSPAQFEELNRQIQKRFPERIQALALAWVEPYAVGCNSITGALALGYDAKLCSSGPTQCGPSRRSPYFDAATIYPYSQLGMRPSMLLAAGSVAAGKALVNRGVTADGSLYEHGASLAQVHYLITSDEARNVRAAIYPPAGPVPGMGVHVHLDQADSLSGVRDVLIYQTGSASVRGLDTVRFLPGALADHLTSFGGRLTDEGSRQMSILKWIDAGATASYGTVSEPCNHREKFPNPQLLLMRYAQGGTALEAYWGSVAWPQQGVFVGDPLAAPFAKAPVSTPVARERAVPSVSAR